MKVQRTQGSSCEACGQKIEDRSLSVTVRDDGEVIYLRAPHCELDINERTGLWNAAEYIEYWGNALIAHVESRKDAERDEKISELQKELDSKQQAKIDAAVKAEAAKRGQCALDELEYIQKKIESILFIVMPEQTGMKFEQIRELVAGRIKDVKQEMANESEAKDV